MIVLDTHTLLFWTSDPDQLGRRAAAAIAGADRLGIPAIVFWEVAMLARKGRIDLGTATREWMDQVLSIPRVEALPLTPRLAMMADSLAMHPDPADRFIVATAMEYQSVLATKDRLLRPLKIVKTIW